MSWQTFPQNFFIVYLIGEDPEHGGQNAAKFFFFFDFATIYHIPEWICFF